MSRVYKGITFNENDSFEMELLKHAGRQGIFARYIKRLIARDMEGSTIEKAILAKVAERELEPFPPTKRNVSIDSFI